MPRFGIRSLLIAFTFIALWLSTFAGHRAGVDLRASILLLIFIGAAVAALCHRGKQRAFWGSFFGVMLLCGGNDLQRPLYRYSPSFIWNSAPVYSYIPSPSPQPAPVSVTSVVPPAAKSGRIAVLPRATAVSPMPWAVATTPNQVFQREAYSSSLAALWTLALATLAGFFGVYIYNHSRKTAE
jgi:hypothetical protein